MSSSVVPYLAGGAVALTLLLANRRKEVASLRIPSKADPKGSVFQVTTSNGYLPVQELRKTIHLPAGFDALEKLLSELPYILHDSDPNALLKRVAALPDYSSSISEKLTAGNLQCLMRDYSILASAYLLEGKTKGPAPRHILPRNIAVPFAKVAKLVDEPAIMSYDSYCLSNGYHISEAPYSEWAWENLRLAREFEGGAEECTFVLVHSEIESRTPELIKAYSLLDEGLPKGSGGKGDLVKVFRGLGGIKETMSRIVVSQLKMFNASDPRNYETHVRPWIFGWKGNADFPNGVLFEGVDEKPTFLRGETGAQSTIIPSLDVVLGVTHKNDILRNMLQELEAYRPKPHREFLSSLRTRFWGRDVGAGGVATEAITGASPVVGQVVDKQTRQLKVSEEYRTHRVKGHLLRDFVVDSGNKDLARLFNECVALIWCFRDIHVSFTQAYIARYTDKDTATGGTPYKAYLRKHRDESFAHQITELGDDCLVSYYIPTEQENEKEIDLVLGDCDNGIPPHLLKRHASIIQQFGNGSPSLQKKSFPKASDISSRPVY